MIRVATGAATATQTHSCWSLPVPPFPLTGCLVRCPVALFSALVGTLVSYNMPGAHRDNTQPRKAVWLPSPSLAPDTPSP